MTVIPIDALFLSSVFFYACKHTVCWPFERECRGTPKVRLHICHTCPSRCVSSSTLARHEVKHLHTRVPRIPSGSQQLTVHCSLSTAQVSPVFYARGVVRHCYRRLRRCDRRSHLGRHRQGDRELHGRRPDGRVLAPRLFGASGLTVPRHLRHVSQRDDRLNVTARCLSRSAASAWSPRTTASTKVPFPSGRGNPATSTSKQHGLVSLLLPSA